MKTYVNTEYEPRQLLKLREYEKTVSTLRIPVVLKQVFEMGISRHGSLPKYFAYLLRKYRLLFYAGKLPFSQNVKTEYQERGTEIFVKTFRPELKDWLEFGMWASALNFSICKLFVILLWFEEEEDFTINEKAFLFAACVLTTLYNLRVPRLVKVLRKGRHILERGISFYEPPE